MSTKIALLGYGNLAKGVEYAVKQNNDIDLVSVFTRRNPDNVKINTNNVPVLPTSELTNWKNKIDVLIICGGSATDLPWQTPECAKSFNVVDSFDTHAKIPEHFANVDSAARSSNKTALISAGWDHGMFSLIRMISEAILPVGENYTFWGKGVSQGHSDAIRRIDGVKDARQYTIPIDSAIDRVRSGELPKLETRDKHTRECFVVAEPGADLEKIEREIVNMPNYFSDYNTTVHFVTEEELIKNHSGLPHGGFVLRSGITGQNSKNVIEYKLKLDSNPEFTGSVLIAYARAIHRLNKEGIFGCKTVFDIPPSYLSNKTDEELRKNFL